jgi:hypothetical protein
VTNWLVYGEYKQQIKVEGKVYLGQCLSLWALIHPWDWWVNSRVVAVLTCVTLVQETAVLTCFTLVQETAVLTCVTLVQETAVLICGSIKN